MHLLLNCTVGRRERGGNVSTVVPDWRIFHHHVARCWRRPDSGTALGAGRDKIVVAETVPDGTVVADTEQLDGEIGEEYFSASSISPINNRHFKWLFRNGVIIRMLTLGEE